MELDDFTSVLANSDFFAMCNDEQKRLLAFASERKYYAAGETIYARGDISRGAFVLMTGQVQAGQPTGTGGAQRISEPGTILGESGLVLERPRRSTLTALTDTQLLFVPRTAFVKLLRQYPDLASSVVARMEDELDGFLSALSRFTGR